MKGAEDWTHMPTGDAPLGPTSTSVPLPAATGCAEARVHPGLCAYAALPKPLSGFGQLEPPPWGNPSSNCISKIISQCRDCLCRLATVSLASEQRGHCSAHVPKLTVRVSRHPSLPAEGGGLADPPQLAQIQSPGVPAAAVLQTGTMPGDHARLLEGQDGSPGFCCSPFTEQLFCWRGITPANKSRAVTRQQLTRPIINYRSDELHKPRDRGGYQGLC